MSGSFGSQLAFLNFLCLDLTHEPLAEAGMRGQILVKARNLMAQVFALGLDENFGIRLLQPSDKQAQETPEQCPEATKHERAPFVPTANRRCLYTSGWMPGTTLPSQ